jgi:hypothetical protein
VKKNVQLVTAELWGGPKDGESIKCRPGDVFCLYRDPVTGDDALGIDCGRFADWVLLGFYSATDPRRLSWTQV